MRKLFFATILLLLALGQVWARTYSGGEILYVRNYRPSEWGSGTDNWKQSGGEFWATFDASETQVKPSRLEPTGDWNDVGTVYCFVVPDGEHTTVTLHRGDKYENPTWSGKTNAITLDATKNYIYDGYNTDASTANWQDLPMFSNGSTMYLIRGWNWSQSNERYAAYFFDGVNSEWVDLTNHSGDIFKCTIPTRKWAYMIMCRMNGSTTDNNWANRWHQTNNIAPSGTGNCVYITNNFSSTEDDEWRLGKYAETPAIAGGMNNWSPVANQFNEGSLTMDLAAGQAYSFKVASGEDNSWYGRNASYDNDLVYVGQTTDETLYSGQHNMMLMTAEAGTYTFEWDSENHQLKITYPSAGNHPSANYYYIAKNASSTGNWNSGGYIYLNFWNGSGPLATWNTDEPRLEYATEIDGENYYYVPVLTDYTSFKAHEKKDGSSGYTTGDQTLAGHAGQYQAYVNSAWGWHTFSFNVEEHNDGGRIWADSVGSYTFGVGATLPTNVTKWGYDFAGWYDNAELRGEPVTAISTTDNGNKDYYAKWASIAQTYPIASHPEFLAAQEGDIIAITVTGVHTSAAIYLKDANYTDIANLSISATGTYTFPLSAASAAGVRTHGLMVTGTNFTYSDVDILYRKEIWSGTLSDNTGWAEVDVDKSIFSGMSGGDFLGFNVTTLGDGKDWHTYAMRADYVQQLSGSCTATGIAVEQLSAANITAISDSKKSVDINAQYLDVSNLYSYTHTRVYSVTLNTNSGTINDGNVTSYTFGTGATLPTDVTRTGYTFAGWYPEEDFEGDRVYTISTTDYGAKTYYAKWTVNVYTVEEHTNGGKINADSIGNYTYGVGATLPTNVTRDGYNFDGWYANEDLLDDPVTEITTSDYGDKEYWAKWTSLEQEKTPATYHRLYAAEEGDILVVNVTAISDGSSIKINKSADGSNLFTKAIAATGKYTFQLNATAATALHTGMILTGTNYTGTVELLLRKTITSTTVSDNTGWTASANLDQSIFAGIEDGDYVGFTISAINDGETWHQYSLCAYDADKDPATEFAANNTTADEGTYIETIKSGQAEHLLEEGRSVFIASQYLDISHFYRYLTTRDYTVTLNTNGGTINAGDVTSYTFGTGATLPTDVNKWGYKFDGWYANSSLEGDAVTTITTSDYGNKEYWAKWTPVTLTFTGDGGTSYDWFKTSCWSPACIPTIEHDVIIKNKATLYGPYGTGAAYNTGDAKTRHAKAKSIVIDKTASENAKIEIWSEASLIVAENITVKKEVEEEVVEGQPTTPADLKMETSILGNGGLICGSGSTTTQATYEFYSKAYKSGRWYINQYVGIPFSSMDAYQLYGFNIYEYNDVKDIWTTPANSTMVPWKAYNPIRKYSGSGSDYDLTGTLNLPGTTGDGRLKDLNCAWRTGESIPLSIDSTAGHQDYMFANSWTAPIHIASMTASDFTDMVATIYIFNAGYVDPENPVKEVGDLAGQWSSFPIASAAEIDNAVIPATQAFCVTATAENAKLTLDYKKHVYDPAIDADSISIFPTRAPKRNQEEMPLSKIRMMVLKDTTMADQLYLFERDDFNDGFDNGWDGHKVFGNATAPQLYTKHGNANFAVDAVPDLEGTVIGFQKGSENSEYTFSFEYKGTAIWYLNDLKAQTSMLISAENTYEFTAEDGDAEARFIISATPIANLPTGVEQTSDNTQDAKVRKVLINDHIYIIRSGRMYDVTGKLAQ